jgi:thiol-disulfide isomerase/thioredoxin
LDISTFLEGRGTDSDPFLIQSVSDLILLRDAVNAHASIPMVSGAEVDAASATYLLTTDLDLSPACSKKSGKNWTPIGNPDILFAGVFDGGGHRVQGLYINNALSNQGLFGALKQAVIRNLTVEGDVIGQERCGLLAGGANGGFIDNCHTKGSIKGDYDTGGVVGDARSHAHVSYCSNEASVQGHNRIGGICGYDYGSVIENCRNGGPVKASYDTGGITGYINYGRVFNSSNTGEVTSYLYVGGIAGYIWQGGKILNSSNFGSVSAGTDYAGGICGYVSSDAALPYMGEALVANCYNAGKVTGSGEYTGALAGFTGMRDNETPGDYDDITAAWVKDSYWLSDGNAGMQTAVAGGTGISENNHALTEAQMKGQAACTDVLYTTADGSSFVTFIDALNAGASEWGPKAMKLPASLGGYNPETILTGWIYAASGTFPSQTDLKAVKPGGGVAEFSLSDTAFDFNATGGDFQTTVTSSLDYSLSPLPAWMEKTAEKTYDNKPHSKTYFFHVAANPGTEGRSSTLSFTNTAGTVLKFSVRQEGMYLQLGKEELVFTGEESSLRFAVSSSVAWHAESDADWCTLPGAVGVGNGIISVHVGANPDKTARSAKITVSSDDGSLVRNVNVMQSGAKEGDVVDWTTREFVHKSLAMRFTATWCGWCPRMNKSILKAQELYPGKISYVALHNNDSDLAFNQVDPLKSQYGINAFPSGIVDGRTLITNQDISVTANNIVNVVKETEQTYGTVTGVDINSSVTGRLAQVDVNVYVKTAGEYKITVLLLEDGIINAQSDYEEGDHSRYVHDNVARVAMSDVTGDSFKTNKDFETMTFSFSANVPASFNLSNMRVLVYVQRAFGSLPVIQSGSYGGYYVDNSADVPLGENLKLALEGGGGGGSSSGGGNNEGIVPGDDINM